MDPVGREVVPTYTPPGLGQVFRSPATADGARRLVVFVHGFNGRAVKTWKDFASAEQQSSWWAESDLYFVGYDSTRREINAVASYLRAWLASVDGLPGSAGNNMPDYQQLVLVGHSLGGVVLRRMIVDEYNRGPAVGSLLFSAGFETRIALFSPATAGFGPTGLLGVLRETGFWGGVHAVLSGSPAYRALSNPDHGILAELRDATQAVMVTDPTGKMLAPTMWADPDGVVVVQPYVGDPPSRYMPGRNHMNVCKPDTRYQIPRVFVEEASS